jgi:hypothetical protein
LIDDGFHAGRCGGDVLRGEASRVIRHLAGKGDDPVFRGNVNGGGFQERLRVKLGLDAGGDGVVGGFSGISATAKTEHEYPREKKDCDP